MIKVQVLDGPESTCQNTVDISVYLQGDINLFTGSRQKELNGLLERGIFETVSLTDILPGTCIFNSQFVDKIKNPGTDKAFEKL
jgi:hypothetical protein